MKRRLAMLLALLLLPASPARAAEREQTEYDGYLVRVSETQEWDGLSLLDAGSWEEISENLYLVEDLDTARAMDRMGGVEYYEPNYRLELLETESYTPTQWNLLAIHAQAAWDHTDHQGDYDARGTGVTVAVIDSGVYAQHPDFHPERILPYYDLGNTGDGVDVWHGTFVAGVIAAQVNNGLGVDGVAPDVNILPICITNGGSTNTARLVQGIDYAVEQGADVINISIGGKSGNESMREAVQRALDAGIIVVAAAGNYKSGEIKSSSTYMYPASYDGVISVSACKQEGEEVVFDSGYSYFNDRITVAAPGTKVQSLYVDGGIATKEGTSFAAPVVTAMAAIAKQRSAAITPETFADLLCASAADLGEEGYDLYYGYGLVDLEAFVQALDATYPISYQLGGEDAVFPEDVQVPTAYSLGEGDIPLPEPVRPGYRFLSWYETEELTGQPVAAIPAGSVGEKIFYAGWRQTSATFFAQYDARGRMLSVTELPQGTTEISPADVTIWTDAVLGKLFYVDEYGAPLRAAESMPLNG